MASYDVREHCLEYLKMHQSRAEGLRDEAAAKVTELDGLLKSASAERDSLTEEVNGLAARVAEFCNVRRVPESVKKWRQELRNAKARKREVCRKIQDMRSDWNKAENLRVKYTLILSQLGGVYAHVERTWIPGCIVQRKPEFTGLIPKF